MVGSLSALRKIYTVTGSRAGGAMNSGPTGFLIVSRRILSTSA
jgi:hypothetical protein